jgi:hypothetical protein
MILGMAGVVHASLWRDIIMRSGMARIMVMAGDEVEVRSRESERRETGEP